MKIRNGLSFSEAGKLGGWKWARLAKKAKHIRILEYNKNPKRCKFCNKGLEYKNHSQKSFCDRSCAISFNNRGRTQAKVIPCLRQ